MTHHEMPDVAVPAVRIAVWGRPLRDGEIPPLRHIGGQELPTVTTRDMKSARRALKAAMADNLIATVDGPAGTGKTWLTVRMVLRIAQQQGRPVFYVQLGDKSSRKEALVRLLRAVDPQASTSAAPYELTEDFLEKIDGLDAIVVVDEAHETGSRGIGQLRTLHDKGNGAFTLILVGTGVNKAIGGDGAVDRRVACRAELRRLEDDELVDVLGELHPMLAGTPTSRLLAIDAEECKGLIGRWVTFLHHALTITAERGLPQDQVTVAVAQAALMLMRSTSPQPAPKRSKKKRRSTKRQPDGTSDAS